jgi:hypothetical protein
MPGVLRILFGIMRICGGIILVYPTVLIFVYAVVLPQAVVGEHVIYVRVTFPLLGVPYRISHMAVIHPLLSILQMHLTVISITTGLISILTALLPEHSTRELKQYREPTKVK